MSKQESYLRCITSRTQAWRSRNKKYLLYLVFAADCRHFDAKFECSFCSPLRNGNGRPVVADYTAEDQLSGGATSHKLPFPVVIPSIITSDLPMSQWGEKTSSVVHFPDPPPLYNRVQKGAGKSLVNFFLLLLREKGGRDLIPFSRLRRQRRSLISSFLWKSAKVKSHSDATGSY